MAERVPVVVVRGNDVCFLGIIRSLAKADIPFVTISFTWDGAKPWWSESSKYFVRDYTIDNPFQSPETALTQVEDIGANLLERWGKPLLVIPSSDTNLMLFIDNEKRLSGYFCLMGDAGFSSYRSDVTHKYECAQLLQSGNTRLCPKTLRCRSAGDIQKILGLVDYPVVFKPAVKDYGQSFYSKYQGLKAVNCDSEGELRGGLESCMEAGFDVIVQEKIQFDRVEDEIPFYCYVDRNHNIRIAATGVKEVIQPYPFGTANVLRLSWHPELLEVASEVVRRLKWRGILMIEFIKDKKDHQWKVIEVNVRPWLFIGFYDRFGLHYLSALYADWCNELEPGESTRTPSHHVTHRGPLHVDLYTLLSNLDTADREAICTHTDRLRGWFEQWGEWLTLTYFDHYDPEPAMAALPAIEDITGLDPDDVHKNIYQKLFDPAQASVPITEVREPS